MSCTYVTAVATHIGYQSSESIKVSIKLVHHANSGKVLEISIHGTFYILQVMPKFQQEDITNSYSAITSSKERLKKVSFIYSIRYSLINA